jgi:hypothetical protein
VYLWSPLVAERLVIGHWPLLLTYAVLPWVFVKARSVRSGEGGMGPVVLLIAAGSLSAAGGVLVTLFAVICLVGRTRAAVRRTVLVVAAAALVNAPWWTAGLLNAGAAVSDPVGVEVFNARGEGGLPAWLTVLTTGGIWNADAAPTSRNGWPVTASLALVLVLSALGARRLRATRHRDRPRRSDLTRLAAAGAVGVALALVGVAVPSTMQWVVANLPGGGLLRDGSRALVLASPLLACLVAHGGRALVDAVTGRTAQTVVATVLVLAPVALLPDLAWGVGGRLEPVSYPEDYAAARAALEQRRATTEDARDVLILPFSSYRAPSWNDRRRTLDPLGRYLTPDYLASDTLVVSGRTVEGEDLRARRISSLLTRLAGAAGGGPSEQLSAGEARRAADALLAEGIGWVALDVEAEAATAGAAPTIRFPDEWLVHEGGRIVIWQLPAPAGDGAVGADDAGPGARAVLALAWVLAAGVLLVAVWQSLRARRSASLGLGRSRVTGSRTGRGRC